MGFLVLAATDVTAPVAVALMTGAVGFGAFSHAGYWANIVDIGPNHAGTLCGISNTIATLPGVLANVSVGYILDTTGDWSIVFLLAAGMYCFGLIVFARYCEGKVLF